jgi:hypothetical protein
MTRMQALDARARQPQGCRLVGLRAQARASEGWRNSSASNWAISSRICTSVHDHVDRALLEQELGALEALRELARARSAR